ncbi:uncharacterized protein CIMG_12605 [Coccidioides immitis RS]|uniref:Uncharacterized protein n=1 Tax=Coccidioides immitis (strain RS) TaxID=246410 RepID=A0A0D8JS27_COCIM|nr:uncharacterized protein CIMG_12605 [Coccidioides immitis RS]KJF59934.1 hypothetical protein CIMG_12605 [Coccidioides immitis RS]
MGPKQYLMRKKIHALMVKQFVKSKSKKYYKHQLIVSQQKKREKKKKHYQEEITETKNKAQQNKKIESKTKLEIKIMIYSYDCLAVSLIKDNNSSSALEKMKKDNFKIVIFSDKNNKKNNEIDNDWIINI